MDTVGQTRSMVERCDVTTCVHNQAQQCQAGTITVAMVDGMAHCATFTSRDEATGIGSTEVRDRSMERRDEA